MKQYWKYLPVPAFLLLYGVSLHRRPLFSPDEYAAVAATVDLIPDPFVIFNSMMLKLLDYEVFALRLGSALSTLLTGLLVYWIGRRNSSRAGVIAAIIYLTSGLVYGLGTAATLLPGPALALTATVCGAAGLFRGRALARTGSGVLALFGLGLLAFSGNSFAYGGFERAELWPFAVFGLLPWLFFAPVIGKGIFKLERDFHWKTALLGIVAAGAATVVFKGGVIGGALLAMPFLALLAAFGVECYFEEEPEAARFNRLMRSLTIFGALGGIALVALQMLVRFRVLPPEQTIYQPGEHWFWPVVGAIVLVGWLQLGVREKTPLMKIGCVAVGFSFLLCAVLQQLPNRVLMRFDSAAMLRSYLAPVLQPGSLLIVEAPLYGDVEWVLKNKLRGDYYYTLMGNDRNASPLDKISELIDKTPGHVVVVTRDTMPESRAGRPLRRSFHRPTGIHILEFYR